MARSFRSLAITFALGLAALAAYGLLQFEARRHAFTPVRSDRSSATLRAVHYSPFQQAIVGELEREMRAGITYQDGYYVGGEPPPGVGVCTDVVIRSFRAAGVDLQKRVQDDIRSERGAYRIEKPDPNIDHRRCRNLMVFFRMNCLQLPENGPDADWRPGDVVFWDTHGDGRVDHVGMVGAHADAKGDPTIIHHWPGLPVSETDGLHRFTIKGHFRWEKKRERKYST